MGVPAGGPARLIGCNPGVSAAGSAGWLWGTAGAGSSWVAASGASVTPPQAATIMDKVTATKKAGWKFFIAVSLIELRPLLTKINENQITQIYL
jgi:hypothetical protein